MGESTWRIIWYDRPNRQKAKLRHAVPLSPWLIRFLRLTVCKAAKRSRKVRVDDGLLNLTAWLFSGTGTRAVSVEQVVFEVRLTRILEVVLGEKSESADCKRRRCNESRQQKWNWLECILTKWDFYSVTECFDPKCLILDTCIYRYKHIRHL